MEINCDDETKLKVLAYLTINGTLVYSNFTLDDKISPKNNEGSRILSQD